MFCVKCGAQLDDDATFCTQCGAKIESFEARNSVKSDNSSANNSNNGITKKLSPNKLISKRNFLIAGVVLVVIVILIAVLNRKQTIEVSKYVSVDFSGYDGAGKAELQLDNSRFKRDFRKLEASERKLEKYDIDYNDDLDELLNWLIIGSLDKKSDLSNGDTVTYNWEISEEDIEIVEDVFGCKLKYDDLDFVVKGLKKVTTFDPFEDITVSFSGVAPYGTAEVKKENYNGLDCSIDKNNGLSNGDTITVNVKLAYSTDEEYIKQYGKLPSPVSKEYTVEGLPTYILNSADIPADLMEYMKKQGEDTINAYVAKSFSDSETLDSMKYLGYIFLTPKSVDRMFNSYVYLLYKNTAKQTMNVRDGSTVEESSDFYYFVRFENPMIDADGKGAVDISRIETPFHSFIKRTDYLTPDGLGVFKYNFTYYGFETYDELYNEIVTKNLQDYNHEDVVEE